VIIFVFDLLSDVIYISLVSTFGYEPVFGICDVSVLKVVSDDISGLVIFSLGIFDDSFVLYIFVVNSVFSCEELILSILFPVL